VPKNGSEYVVRFERGKFVLTASTEDERLTVPVRIASLLAGLLLAPLGLGGAALLGHEILTGGLSALLWLLGGLLLLLVVGGYGLDLVGRGILGRPWSRRFWTAADRWVSTRVKPWHGVAVLLLIFVAPTVADVIKEGWRGLESVVVLLSFLAQVVIHEAGHLAAAGAVGYRPRRLYAGPFVLHLDGPRPRLSLGLSWLMFFGGLASYEPVARTRQKDLWVAAAGPLANLLASALVLERWGWPTRSGFWQAFLACFIGMGIATGLLNLIPFPRTSGGFALDGREILDLLRGRH
jgi:Zn-dependent protease